MSKNLNQYLTGIRERAMRLDAKDDQLRQRIVAYEEILNGNQPGCRVEFTVIEGVPVCWGKTSGTWRFMWGMNPIVHAPRHIRAEFIKVLTDDQIFPAVIAALDMELERRADI